MKESSSKTKKRTSRGEITIDLKESGAEEDEALKNIQNKIVL